jgi:hypothetical protein
MARAAHGDGKSIEDGGMGRSSQRPEQLVVSARIVKQDLRLHLVLINFVIEELSDAYLTTIILPNINFFAKF